MFVELEQTFETRHHRRARVKCTNVLCVLHVCIIARIKSVAALTRKYTEIQRITYAAKARHSKMVCRLLLVFLFRCGVRRRFVGPQGCRPSYVTQWIQLHGTPLFAYICSTTWWIIFNPWQMKYRRSNRLLKLYRVFDYRCSRIRKSQGDSSKRGL